jgi:outer membrane protein
MKFITTIFLFVLLVQTTAQPINEKWDLRKCVEYAAKNNISVKQADVQARISALQLKQAQYYLYPSASFSTGLSGQNGRSIDPTTNLYSTQQLLSQNLGFQGSLPLYSFGRVRKSIESAQFSAEAALIDIEKAANDVSISVATYYLQVLAAKEQVHISEVKINQTNAQLDITKKRVDAGVVPELNVLELEAQLANDSSTLITNKTTYDQSILSLKGLLNIDAAKPFELETPPVDRIPLESFIELEPEMVYKLAITLQPTQRSNELKIKAAEQNVKANKAALYPTISSTYSLGSTYNNKAITNTGSKQPYFNQIDQNFRQSLGLSLNVPIFSNGTNRINYENAKLTLQNNLVNKEQADQKLKLDIYTAYTNAVNSLQKYNASKRSVENAQKAYDNASKRYDVGLLSTLDLITNQNNLQTAKLQEVASHYDYVFRMKLLEFYKGQGLKL